MKGLSLWKVLSSKNMNWTHKLTLSGKYNFFHTNLHRIKRKC